MPPAPHCGHRRAWAERADWSAIKPTSNRFRFRDVRVACFAFFAARSTWYWDGP